MAVSKKQYICGFDTICSHDCSVVQPLDLFLVLLLVHRGVEGRVWKIPSSAGYTCQLVGELSANLETSLLTQRCFPERANLDKQWVMTES